MELRIPRLSHGTDCRGDGMVVAARRTTRICQQTRHPVPATPAIEVSSFSHRNAFIDDDFLHLPHQLCHHRPPADDTLYRGRHDDYGRSRRRGLLRRADIRLADAHIPPAHQVFCQYSITGFQTAKCTVFQLKKKERSFIVQSHSHTQGNQRIKGRTTLFR